jgi:gliding motility-associated GldM-like protein
MNRRAIVVIFLFRSFISSGQEVTNESPYVNNDFKKYLYVNFDNPVYISTGKYKSLKIKVSNGKITKTKTPGKYLIKPERCETTIVTLIGSGYRKEFSFECAIMHYPEIDFLGYRYDDNVPSVRRSEGIYAIHTPLDLDISYHIDSFQVTISDSLGHRTHVNVGPRWDAISSEMIHQAKRGSVLLIDKIALTGPDNRRYSGQTFKITIWE